MAISDRYTGNSKLVAISDLRQVLTEEGKTACALYNVGGGLLLKSDTKPPEALYSKTVFVYEHEKPQFKKGDLAIEKKESAEGVIEIIEDRSQELAAIKEQKAIKKKQVMDKVGINTVKLYDASIDSIKEILDSPQMGKAQLAAARDIVEETYKQDRFDLVSCISELRDADTYTYNHSLSVYVLFAQAMEDLSKYLQRDEFFSLFKSLNRNINFNKESIKKYSMGALLHDYGKMLIDKEILNKPSKLTDHEFGQMKRHPSLGVEELVRHGFEDRELLEIVGNHHARYMTFNSEKQSPLAQLCNIVDVFDACNSSRVYKEGFSYAKTKSILMKEMLSNDWDRFLFETVVQDTFDKMIRYKTTLFTG
jgi:HD-GYP domain-containing protein (c-di-GMP phosphodiesterase class II)